MKWMKKELDSLHKVLLGSIVLAIVIIFGQYLVPAKKVVNKKSHTFYQAKLKAVSLLLVNDFEGAEMAFLKMDSLFPKKSKLAKNLALLADKQESYTHYNELKEDIDSHIETIENLESYMTIIESRYKHLKNENTLAGLADIADENTDEFDTDIPTKVVDKPLKSILQFKNFDGIEIKYIGEVSNDKANGYGYAVFDKRGFYEGNWIDNLRNGDGIYYWQSGDVYEGKFVNGKREGQGIYVFASGEVYSGYWKNNLRHGKGILKSRKGKLVFEGQWNEDEPVPTSRSKNK